MVMQESQASKVHQEALARMVALEDLDWQVQR